MVVLADAFSSIDSSSLDQAAQDYFLTSVFNQRGCYASA